MKTLFLMVALVTTCLCLAMAPVVIGPFLFSIPVVGISEDSLPALEDAFHEALGDRNFLHPEVKAGELHFYGGGGGFKALLSLAKMTEAVTQAGLTIDRDRWMLKEQIVGVYVAAKEPMATPDVIAALENIDGVSVEGSLLVGDQTYQVLHLERPIRHADFVANLSNAQLTSKDLLWGHWKYGWKIDEGDDGHSHDMGMTLIRKTASD